jgi:hypothetical protein
MEPKELEHLWSEHLAGRNRSAHRSRGMAPVWVKRRALNLRTVRGETVVTGQSLLAAVDRS